MKIVSMTLFALVTLSSFAGSFDPIWIANNGMKVEMMPIEARGRDDVEESYVTANLTLVCSTKKAKAKCTKLSLEGADRSVIEVQYMGFGVRSFDWNRTC